MLKPMLVGAAALLSLGANPMPLDEPATNFNAIGRLECEGGWGTAFWIDDTTMITAAHVSSLGGCTIYGHPVTARSDGAQDFAILTGPRNRNHIEVDCSGVREGRIYHATGFPGPRVTSRLLATRESIAGFVVLLGQVWGGMSGGPVIGRRGRVAAIVNLRSTEGVHRAFVLPLADTPVCRRD